MPHVNLNRTFSRPSRDETDESYVEFASYLGKTHDWLGILDAKITVILASAASGKTQEFREQAKSLTDANTLGVFCALEELASQPIEDCLTPEVDEKLQAWRKGEGEAIFFLDSVDEAKIADPAGFRRALRKLSKFLGDHRSRVRFVVSCRPSDWSRGIDETTLIEALRPVEASSNMQEKEPEILTERQRIERIVAPLLEKREGRNEEQKGQATRDAKNGSSNSVVQTWVLNPLDFSQQRRLAGEGGGVEDLDGFMAGIAQQGLDAFAARPGDLLDLAAHWNSEGAFGSRQSMIEAGIDRLLNENATHRRDGDRLSDDFAKTGAKRLAAALILARQFTLRAPGAGDSQGALDPKKILDDWTDGQRETLLRRGLFAPASFGKVRFQHRSSLEYLAALWFEDVLADPRKAEEAEKLLFKSIFGVETVTPELRPVVAWLSLKNERIRERVLQLEPIELIRHGDPRAFPIPFRCRLLDRFTRAEAAGDVANVTADPQAIWAFSDPELADTIRAAWARNNGLMNRSLLLAMIQQGRITTCAELVATQASPQCTECRLTIPAILCLVALEQKSSLREVAVSGQTALRRQFQRRNLGKWPKIRFATSRPRLKSSSLAC